MTNVKMARTKEDDALWIGN